MSTMQKQDCKNGKDEETIKKLCGVDIKGLLIM